MRDAFKTAVYAVVVFAVAILGRIIWRLMQARVWIDRQIWGTDGKK